MRVDLPAARAEVEVVFVEHTHEAVSRVETYVRLRAQFSLPPLVWHVVGDRLRLTFDAIPPLARVQELSRSEVAYVLHRLGTLEGALGWNLVGVSASALRYDPIRRVPAITAGLFEAPQGGPSAVGRLLDALGVHDGHEPHSVRAAIATLAAVLPQHARGDDEASMIRALLDAAIADRAAGRSTVAATALRHAWTLRIGDAEVGRQWLELANETGVELSAGVEEALEPPAERDPRLLSALVRRAQRTGNTTKAVERARALARLAPEMPLGWRVLAGASRHEPMSGEFRAAMLGLARAGDERALQWVWEAIGPEAAGPLLDDWSHPWTPASVGLRLRWLGHQERLRDLLQFYFAVSPTIRPLDEDALGVVVAGAARIPGRLQALRERMRLLLQEGVERPLVRAYVAASQLDQVPEAIVEADRMWPGEVPSPPLARALLAVDSFEEAIKHAEAAGLQEIRLQALARQALLAGGRAPTWALRDAVNRLGVRSVEVSTLVAELRRVAPQGEITAQLQRLIEESA